MTTDTRTSITPTRQQLWHAGKGPMLVGLVLVVLGILTAAVGSTDRGFLDPRAVDSSGSRALAELLRAQGVTVQLVETTAAAEAATVGDTLLIADSDRLGASQLEALKSTPADVVLLSPDTDALAAFAPELGRAGSSLPEAHEPRCELPAAVAAGSAEVGERLYIPRPEAVGAVVSCYPVEQAAALIQVNRGARRVTVLGASELLTNDQLDEQGNAALAMGLLGTRSRLYWYLPSVADVPPQDQQSFFELLPAGWWWGSAQLIIGAILLAAWRARRLGPVVAEPLPVIVRATETVEGRARLYRRARARDRAAAELREAAIRRLVPLVGLPRAAQPAAVVEALTVRTGRAPGAIGELLYGPAPANDDALIGLATSLDSLEAEVRRS